MSVRGTALLTAIGLLADPNPGPAQSCPLYVLERSEDAFMLQRETVADGEAKVYVWSGDFLTLILPWSPGQSGEVIQASRGPGASAVRCEAGSIRVTHQQPGVEPRTLPALQAAAVGHYRMRVSVTPDTGTPIAFIVHPNGSIARDTLAPATDMFGGRVPLQPGDVAVTTEIREAEVGAPVVGSVELRRGGPYFLATLAVAGGGEGEAILDFGASRTLLSQDMLPPGVKPMPLMAVEHGPEGARESAGSLGALSGDVGDVAVARLPEVRMGTLSFADVRVNVVPRLPELAGLEVKGILGADILQRAAVVLLTERGGARLEFLAEKSDATPTLEAPFSLVGGLIVMSGTVEGRSIPLILDTGARGTLLAESLARDLDLEPLSEDGDTFRGLDGTPVETWAALIPSLGLGNGSLDSLRVNIGSLPVLERMGLSGGGLLGQDLWERFDSLEVDWRAGVVRWFR